MEIGKAPELTCKHMSLNTYKINIEKYRAEVSALGQSLNTLSMFRLGVFLFSAVLVTFLAVQGATALVWIVAPLCIFGFGALVSRYNRVEADKRHAAFLLEINEQEVLRLENKLADLPAAPNTADRNHAYAADLDIFGAHSLFKLLNRTTTEPGQSLLAEWLLAPATRATILERQQAVKELGPKVAWRQHFQASGMHYRHTRQDYDRLLHWIAQPALLLSRSTVYLAAAMVLTVVSTAAAIYFLSHVLTVRDVEEILPYFAPLAAIMAINTLVLRTVAPAVESLTQNIDHHVRILGGFRSLIARIESEQFQSSRLQVLQSALRHNNYSATLEISRLSRVLEVLQVKGRKREFSNAFYAIFNLLWFLDIHLVIRAERWKERNRAYLEGWASAISEFEVLSSVAGFHYANAGYTFPEIEDAPYVIQFKALGHPLLGTGSRICNDFELNGRGQIAMITGSNMAGKSTFLRTIGTNLVLALMGAPCCAAWGNVSNMKIFTSMRTQDNLEEGVSSFYAELKRIEQLLKLIESGQELFFMLDEMFKGTNSQDRYKGGVSLIRQLNALNAFGIISTHDLELARLAGNHMIVANYNFHSTIEAGELIFNYKITEGICKDFNASELMRRSGIRILSDVGENSDVSVKG